MKKLLKLFVCLYVLISANLAFGQALCLLSDGMQRVNNNLLTYSEQVDNAIWVKTAATATANSVVAPDGNTTGDTLAETASTSDHNIRQSLSVVTGNEYVIGTYARLGTRTFVQVSTTSTGFGTARYANFNLTTCAVGTVGASTTATATAFDNGWCRVEIKATATSSATTLAYFVIITNSAAANFESYLGVASNNLYLWGMQARLGYNSTAYVPTTSAAVSANQSFTTDAISAASISTAGADKIRENILTRSIEGNYSTGTFGYYVEEIKKFVANRMTKSGTAWTLYKDDKTTVYKTGTTTGAERAVP